MNFVSNNRRRYSRERAPQSLLHGPTYLPKNYYICTSLAAQSTHSSTWKSRRSFFATAAANASSETFAQLCVNLKPCTFLYSLFHTLVLQGFSVSQKCMYVRAFRGLVGACMFLSYSFDVTQPGIGVGLCVSLIRRIVRKTVCCYIYICIEIL